MTQVASIDYPNKRIYLHFDTVSNGVDPVAAYKEVRELRRTTEGDRRYSPLIRSQGNEPKGGGVFTPRRALLLDGARFVPYDTSHTLRVLTEIITDDEQSGAGAFDRLPLSGGVDVDIDIAYQQVEIITVPTGGALTATQATQLSELYQALASAGVFSAAALANAPSGTGGDASAANQTAIISAIAQLKDILDLLGYTPGQALTRSESGSMTTLTVGSKRVVIEDVNDATTTITRNDP